MYIPAHFAADEATVGELLRNHGAADLVTLTAEGLTATLLPFVYLPEAGEHGTLHGHLARNNPQWKLPRSGTRWRSSAARTRTSRRPGTRPRPSTAAWCRPGTT